MKIYIQEKTDFKDLIYPLIMQSNNGSIAIFTSERKGIYIHHYKDDSQNGYEIYLNDTNVINWQPFNGKITLSNQ